MKKKAVFLDRDGVINEIVYHKEMGILDSPFTADQLKLFPKVGEAINTFHTLGYQVIVVSNQPGMAKDHFTMETFQEIQGKMRQELHKQKAHVDAEYYCFHHPYASVKSYKKICDCRKPKPGMLLSAANDHHLDLAASWMIGDGVTDIQAGKAAGCTTILIGRMKCELCKLLDDKDTCPDYIKPNLYKASLVIKQRERG